MNSGPRLANSGDDAQRIENDALGVIATIYGLAPVARQRLHELAFGLSYKEIATNHGITLNTVKTEVRRLWAVLGIDCRHELDHAVRSAYLRAAAGQSVLEVSDFLLLRLE